MATGAPHQTAVALLVTLVFASIGSAIFHQRAVHLPPTNQDPSISPTATVFVQQQPQPIRTLLARSLEPLMAAALSSISILPNGYATISGSVPMGTGTSPFGTFARFTAASGSHTNLYTTQWNVLPFSVGRYCDNQIISEPEYQQCRADAAMNWRAAEHNLDGRASIDPMRACCFFW